MTALGSPAWNRLILDGGEQLGVPVSDAQLRLLAAHATELLRWNRKTNLTSITDPEEIATKHVLDSFAALPELPSHASLLDVGSGWWLSGLGAENNAAGIFRFVDRQCQEKDQLSFPCHSGARLVEYCRTSHPGRSPG